MIVTDRLDEELAALLLAEGTQLRAGVQNVTIADMNQAFARIRSRHDRAFSAGIHVAATFPSLIVPTSAVHCHLLTPGPMVRAHRIVGTIPLVEFPFEPDADLRARLEEAAAKRGMRIETFVSRLIEAEFPRGSRPTTWIDDPLDPSLPVPAADVKDWLNDPRVVRQRAADSGIDPDPEDPARELFADFRPIFADEAQSDAPDGLPASFFEVFEKYANADAVPASEIDGFGP